MINGATRIIINRGGGPEPRGPGGGGRALHLLRGAHGLREEDAGLSVMEPWPAAPLASELVLGYIETKFCNQIRILQQFSKSTKLSS